MALPKINSNPSYSVTVPSTGQKVTYRPYLVKEEKVLMIAFESGDSAHIMREIVGTLKACINEDVNFDTLTTFDVEYLFTTVRSKSVGEVSTVLMKCNSCEEKNEVDIRLDNIVVTESSAEKDVQVTDTIFVTQTYPKFKDVMAGGIELTGNALQDGFEMVKMSIDTIKTEDEIFTRDDFTNEELDEFIGSMTTDQFATVSKFLQDMPVMKYDGQFDCVKCGHHNEFELKGLADFL
jgi:hypothetical protein